jgi:hypothetical protein
MSRLSTHYKEGVKQFDRYSFREFKGSEKQRKAHEKRLIKRFNPKYNITHRKTRKIKIIYQPF